MEFKSHNYDKSNTITYFERSNIVNNMLPQIEEAFSESKMSEENFMSLEEEKHCIDYIGEKSRFQYMSLLDVVNERQECEKEIFTSVANFKSKVF